MQQAGSIVTLAAGQYRLRDRLAGSAYGVLWRADGPARIGQVAIKLVNREQMEGADAGQRDRWVACATNEIGFLGALQPWDQRHIVRLLDSGVHEGLPAMALELLDGDLGRHVAARRAAGRPIPFMLALDWIAQVNQALAKVHQYGWRYLDLKPGNLLLDGQRGLKLADFGTNRLLSEPHPHSYTGTANWQAPEQFFGDRAQGYHTDARTDYFALGALFYYLVTGGQPLRFCSACGEAFRAHGPGGANRLLAQHGGALPPVLDAGEEVLFAQRAGVAARSAHRGGAALDMLRSLLAARREQRPRHALEISRMIARVRQAVQAPASWRSAA
ncbi:MAG: protein kinase domain-containing protein [Massilia sp.]